MKRIFTLMIFTFLLCGFFSKVTLVREANFRLNTKAYDNFYEDGLENDDKDAYEGTGDSSDDSSDSDERLGEDSDIRVHINHVYFDPDTNEEEGVFEEKIVKRGDIYTFDPVTTTSKKYKLISIYVNDMVSYDDYVVINNETNIVYNYEKIVNKRYNVSYKYSYRTNIYGGESSLKETSKETKIIEEGKNFKLNLQSSFAGEEYTLDSIYINNVKYNGASYGNVFEMTIDNNYDIVFNYERTTYKNVKVNVISNYYDVVANMTYEYDAVYDATNKDAFKVPCKTQRDGVKYKLKKVLINGKTLSNYNSFISDESFSYKFDSDTRLEFFFEVSSPVKVELSATYKDLSSGKVTTKDLGTFTGYEVCDVSVKLDAKDSSSYPNAKLVSITCNNKTSNKDAYAKNIYGNKFTCSFKDNSNIVFNYEYTLPYNVEIVRNICEINEEKNKTIKTYFDSKETFMANYEEKYVEVIPKGLYIYDIEITEDGKTRKVTNVKNDAIKYEFLIKANTKIVINYRKNVSDIYIKYIFNNKVTGKTSEYIAKDSMVYDPYNIYNVVNEKYLYEGHTYKEDYATVNGKRVKRIDSTYSKCTSDMKVIVYYEVTDYSILKEIHNYKDQKSGKTYKTEKETLFFGPQTMKVSPITKYDGKDDYVLKSFKINGKNLTVTSDSEFTFSTDATLEFNYERPNEKQGIIKNDNSQNTNNKDLKNSKDSKNSKKTSKNTIDSKNNNEESNEEKVTVKEDNKNNEVIEENLKDVSNANENINDENKDKKNDKNNDKSNDEKTSLFNLSKSNIAPYIILLIILVIVFIAGIIVLLRNENDDIDDDIDDDSYDDYEYDGDDSDDFDENVTHDREDDFERDYEEGDDFDR